MNAEELENKLLNSDSDSPYLTRMVARELIESAAATIRRLHAENERLRAENGRLRAARISYANLFELNNEGEPDVGSIHENIRKLRAENEAMERRLQALAMLAVSEVSHG